MKEEDQIKTSFITSYGTYYYITMPFGLKNAGSTYQHCMQRCQHEQIGKNVHIYIDDIAIVSKEKDTLLDDLRETFDNLRWGPLTVSRAFLAFIKGGKLRLDGATPHLLHQ